MYRDPLMRVSSSIRLCCRWMALQSWDALIHSTTVGEHCPLTIANTCHVTSSHMARLSSMRRIRSLHRSSSNSLASSSGKGGSISGWKPRSSGSITIWNSPPPLMLWLTKSTISHVVLSNRSFPPQIPPTSYMWSLISACLASYDEQLPPWHQFWLQQQTLRPPRA